MSTASYGVTHHPEASNAFASVIQEAQSLINFNEKNIKRDYVYANSMQQQRQSVLVSTRSAIAAAALTAFHAKEMIMEDDSFSSPIDLSMKKCVQYIQSLNNLVCSNN